MALLGSQADADEATQETLLRAHRAMATYRGEGSIKAWLCGIRDGLAKLKPTEREALVLRFVADLSHREIAIACNLDEATARKRTSRALARLRSILPDGVE